MIKKIIALSTTIILGLGNLSSFPTVYAKENTLKSVQNKRSSIQTDLSKANQEVQAILSNDELNELLQISVDVPILKRKRVTYSKNTPIEYSLNYYKGDIYTMVMTINN